MGNDWVRGTYNALHGFLVAEGNKKPLSRQEPREEALLFALMGEGVSVFVEKFFEKALFFACVVLAKRGCEGGEELFLFCRKVFGSLHVNGKDKVALALGVNVGDTLTLESEGRSGLRSLRNGIFLGFAAESGYVYLCSECRLCEGNRNLAIYVVAFSCKDVVGLNSYVDYKVAVSSAASSCGALTSEDYALSRINSCGNGHLQLLINLDVTLAVTVFTGSFNDFSRTAAGGAGSLSLHISKHRLLLDGNTTRTVTGGAGFGAGSLCGA